MPKDAQSVFNGFVQWLIGRKVSYDKRMRYNLLEKRALEKNRVRELVFVSGNMSGQEIAETLELGIRKMLNMRSRIDPPFVAAIMRSGEVHLRWPKR